MQEKPPYVLFELFCADVDESFKNYKLSLYTSSIFFNKLFNETTERHLQNTS